MGPSTRALVGDIIIQVAFYYLRNGTMLFLATTDQLSQCYVHHDSGEQKECGLKLSPKTKYVTLNLVLG